MMIIPAKGALIDDLKWGGESVLCGRGLEKAVNHIDPHHTHSFRPVLDRAVKIRGVNTDPEDHIGYSSSAKETPSQKHELTILSAVLGLDSGRK